MKGQNIKVGDLVNYLASEARTQVHREIELRKALMRAITHMKSHASQTGSMHGWWDIIGELEEIANKDNS